MRPIVVCGAGAALSPARAARAGPEALPAWAFSNSRPATVAHPATGPRRGGLCARVWCNITRALRRTGVGATVQGLQLHAAQLGMQLACSD